MSDDVPERFRENEIQKKSGLGEPRQAGRAVPITAD